MKKATRFIAPLMAIILLATLLAGCVQQQAVDQPEPETKTLVKVAALKGPTGIGMVKLMEDSKAGITANDYEFELLGAPDDIVSKLTSGSVDVAAVPTNLAAVLHSKTNGNIQLIAINTLGVLYVLENGNSIQSIADLKGKTITTVGQGATPEYALNYLLKQNGLVPGEDVTVEYLSEHSELAALAASGKADLVMLPEPFVTLVLAKNSDVRIALDITEEWKQATAKPDAPGVELTMGCLVVRKEFAEANKEALDTFLSEYKASTAFVNEHIDEAAEMVVAHGIMADAALAKKAIPNCNIVYMDGDAMKQSATVFYDVLFSANPKAVGGKMPSDDFYYAK